METERLNEVDYQINADGNIVIELNNGGGIVLEPDQAYSLGIKLKEKASKAQERQE